MEEPVAAKTGGMGVMLVAIAAIVCGLGPVSLKGDPRRHE